MEAGYQRSTGLFLLSQKQKRQRPDTNAAPTFTNNVQFLSQQEPARGQIPKEHRTFINMRDFLSQTKVRGRIPKEHTTFI